MKNLISKTETYAEKKRNLTGNPVRLKVKNHPCFGGMASK
jgi:hypothetical protein